MLKVGPQGRSGCFVAQQSAAQRRPSGRSRAPRCSCRRPCASACVSSAPALPQRGARGGRLGCVPTALPDCAARVRPGSGLAVRLPPSSLLRDRRLASRTLHPFGTPPRPRASPSRGGSPVSLGRARLGPQPIRPNLTRLEPELVQLPQSVRELGPSKLANGWQLSTICCATFAPAPSADPRLFLSKLAEVGPASAQARSSPGQIGRVWFTSSHVWAQSDFGRIRAVSAPFGPNSTRTSAENSCTR